MPNTFTIKTTAEWDSTSMNSEIIPRGDLCIESFDDGDMKLKIGDGLRVFKQLPYICHCHDEDYYTKEEIDVMIDDIKTNLDNYYTKTEIDELLSSLKSELTQYVDDHTHTHDNKDILDQITAPFTIEEKEKIKDIIDVSGYNERISDLESVSHTHDNKDILDSITTEDVDSWHTHDNQSILDNTTASFTVNYKNILDNMTTYKIFEPASAYESGSVGLVPAPNRGDHTKFLRGDGKWVYVEGGGGGQLEPATRTTLGGVIIGNGINVDENGLISVEEIEPYELPTASSSTLGGVKIGNNIDINNGVISVTFPDIPEPYILPKATSSSLGGVVVGNNIDVNDGVISVTFPTDAQTVNRHTVESDVPADAKFTDTIGVLSVTQDQSNLNELIVEYEDHSDRLAIPDTKYYEGTAIDVITDGNPGANERRIQYIEFPPQYQNFIKLNYSPIGSTNVELECEIYPNSNNYWGIFGARRDMAGYVIESFQLGMGHNDTLFWWGRGDSLQTADSTITGFRTAQSDQLVNTHLLIKTTGSTITVTNVDTGEVLINEDHPLPFTASNYNMNLFSIARKDVSGYSDPIGGKIYSFKIYEGTTLVRNYIPVEHNRYGIVLHEMIGNTYHAPDSSSNVNAGPYLDPIPYLNSINVLYSTGLSVNDDNELINTGVLDIQESSNPLEIVKITSDATETVGITLPIAASDTLGGVKVGNGLSIDSTGSLSAIPPVIPEYHAGTGISLSNSTIERCHVCQYIRNDGTNYVRTGIMEDASPFKVDITYQVYDTTPLTQRNHSAYLLSSYDEVNGIEFGMTTQLSSKMGVVQTICGMFDSSDNWRSYYWDPISGENTYSLTYTLPKTVNISGSYSIGGELGGDTDTTFKETNELTIFGDSISCSDIEYYVSSIKVYKYDILTANLVPCYRESDSKTGFYDRIRNVFLTEEVGNGLIHGPETGDVIETGSVSPSETDITITNVGVIDIQSSTNPLEFIKVTSDDTEAIDIKLPIASANVLGGVKVGDGLSIDNTGVLSANIQENGVLDVSVNLEDPYKLDIAFSDHTKTIKLPDPLDIGVIDVRAQQDETVAVLEVEKTSGVSEIDLIALLQGLTINVNFSDDGSVINRAIINKHAYERANLTEIISNDDVINNQRVSERANLALTATDVITNTHAVIPDES